MASVQGTLRIDGNGCSRIGYRGVVWPNGTTWDHDSNEVVMGDGRRFAIDEELRGAGGYTSARFVTELEMSGLESQVGAEVADLAEQCYGTSEIAILNNWSGSIDASSNG